MKTAILLGVALLALSLSAPLATAESPCGPNVSNCRPFEPCRSPTNLVGQIVCDPENADDYLPIAP